MNPGSEDAAQSRKERDRSIRRQDLMNAAERLFAERGFHNTSMEEIAKQGGYGTGTIYLYFKSKEELYHALLHDKMIAYSEELKKQIDITQSAWDKLRTIIRSKFSFFQEHQSFLRIYVTHFITPDSQLAAGLTPEAQHVKDWFYGQIQRAFEEGMAKGEFHPADPALALAAFTGMTDSVLLHCFGVGGTVDLAASEEFVTRLFATGLRIQT